MSELYPLKFKPIFKEKLWGGQKIKTILGKDFGDLENCGETWELSGVSGDVSMVVNGELSGTFLSKLIEDYKEDLVGKSILKDFGEEFPLLIKFLDANKDLSVQVHPDDELAKSRHGSLGKAEMWYVLQADHGASLINGFEKSTDRVEFLDHLRSGNLSSLLHQEKVTEGDVYYLPAGRVHTIGKGLMVAEIQQTSDITYRIYDFDRVGKDGKKRELHTELALDAIDFSKAENVKSTYSKSINQTNSIISTPYFTTNKLSITENHVVNRSELDCFKIYIGVGGEGKIGGESISFGEVILVPAVMKEYIIEPEGELELLETYIDASTSST